MKPFDYVKLAMLFTIFGAIIWIQLHNTHDHEDFFYDVRGFIEKGGRNTAQQGKALCERLNVLETMNGIEPTYCEGIYR